MTAVRRLSIAAVLLGLLAPVVAQAQQTQTPEQKLLLAVKQLQAARKGSEPTAEMEDRIRHITWLLFVGELAAENGLDLSSNAIDAIRNGLDKFDEFEKKVKADPDLERKLAENTLLTMRMDVARQRRGQAENKEKLSRTQELERLRQLRELNNLYRDMTNQITAMNTQFLVGDYPGVRKTSEAVTGNIKKVREVASARRDFYLFKDEPKLDAADAAELKLVNTVTEPIIHDLVAHFQSLQAMMAYRLATVDPAKPDRTLLEEAHKLASDVLTIPAATNLIALYVQGISQRDLGTLLTTADPLDPKAHQAASVHYDAAKKSFDAAVKRLKDEPTTGKMMSDELKLRLDQMSDVKVYLAEAEKLNLAGKLEKAREVLLEGGKIHRSEKILVARIEVEMRLGTDLAQVRPLLKRALDDKLLTDDPANLLLQGRVELTEAWDRISREGVEKMNADKRKELDDQIKNARVLLTQAATKSDNKPMHPTVQAYVALSYAYGTVLDPKGETKEAEAMLNKLPPVASELDKQVKNAKGQDETNLREALVAAYMAQGYLSVRLLKEFRVEAMNAFAAAADAQAKLPFTRSTLKLFGSPYVAAFLSRPEGQTIQIAQEERQLRDLLASFAEAAVALNLGEPDAAANQMNKALEQIELGTGPAIVDPAKLLEKSDADARAAMAIRTRSMAVMTLVAGKKYDAALVASLKPVLPGIQAAQLDTIEIDKLDKAIEKAGEPLGVYSIGLALEEYASSKYDPKNPRYRELFRLATKTQQQAKKQIDASVLFSERYPQLVKLNERAIERLTDPQVYLKRAAELRREFRLTEATQVLTDGAKRHPTAQGLIDELIYTRIDEAALNPDGTDQPLKLALVLAEQAKKDGLLQGARSFLALGELHERLKQPKEAKAAYELALGAKPSDEDKIKAQARLAVLTARLEN